MTTPTYAQYKQLSSALAGLSAETIEERLLTLFSVVASGQNPDGTPAPAQSASYVLAGVKSLAAYNGSTDGTAINALLTALGGPGVVLLPAGTGVIDQTIVLGTGQYLVGFGMNATILQAKNSLNADVIQTTNFATLTGTDTTTTPNNLGFSGITIDGNKANNTSGRGCSSYASNMRLFDFTIRNCAGMGLWTEWGSTSAAVAGSESMENFITNFKIHDCVGEVGVSTHGVTTNAAGWCFLGPHDTQVNDGVLFFNGTDSAVTHQGQSGIGIPANLFGNGATFDNIHIFGGQTDYGIRNAGSGITFGPRMQCEGGRLAQMFLDGASTCRLQGKFFSGGVSTSTTVGVKVANASSACSGIVKVENCGGGVIDWTGAGGDHHLTIHATHTTQAPPSPASVGAPGANSRIEQVVTDTAGKLVAADTFMTLTGTISAGGASGAVWPRESLLNGSGTVRRSLSRLGANGADTNPLSTGVLYLVAIELLAGDKVNNLTFRSHTTAAGTPTNWWFALYDPSYNLLSQTADQLTAAWATFTAKTLALTAAQTIATDGVYYAAVMVKATTCPSLDGVSGSSGATGAAAYVSTEKLIAGTFSTGLTTTAPASAATPTAVGIIAMAVTS